MDPVCREILSRVVSAYERALADSPPARAWLAEHGVPDARLHERFRLGWASGKLAHLARGEVLDRLRTLGLVDAEGRDRFADVLAIPTFDADGSVVQIAFCDRERKIRWLFPEETPVFWNGAALGHARDVVIAPDPLAALVEISAGRDATIALAGPGTPLGQGAKDQLLAHASRVTLLPGTEHLHGQIETLGLAIATAKPPSGERIVDQDANGFTVEFPRRLRFVVQGLAHDSPRHLRASVKCLRRPPEGIVAARPRIHLDTLDLYHARSRVAFARTAACLLGEDPALMEDHLAKVVALAEDFLHERAKAAPAVIVSEPDREEAVKLLADPKLLDRVLADLGALGTVGEEPNKLVAYVASVSRKLDDPLSVLVLSRSAAGKSTLAEAVAALAPPEDVARFTRLTAQTLYYQKPRALEHKLVLIEEAEGVEDAAYALRILQSARCLSLSTAAGHGEAKIREVKGPVSLFVTTTRTDLDEETVGRFLTLSVDESVEQTRAILAAQRQMEARVPGERERILVLHRNAQRLLEPRAVVNPYAPLLTFPDDRLSARRDHRKYLGLIRAVAFVHQHQRKTEGGAVVVALEDIAIANRLAQEALGQSIYDLSPPSRRLLLEIRQWRPVEEFSQRELRAKTGWKRTQLAEHVKELVETEYLVVHTTGPGRRTRYRMDWDGQGMDGERFYKGLTDVATLSARIGPDTTAAPGRSTSGSRPAHVRGPFARRRTPPGAPPGPADAPSGPDGRSSAEGRA
ncbi:MAG: hypothetical protein HYY16_09130 [Planctomycetes bacterium]|nr:hypothetical protein [Planctomycetota bacterium]